MSGALHASGDVLEVLEGVEGPPGPDLARTRRRPESRGAGAGEEEAAGAVTDCGGGVYAWVERFDRRPIEPFELFTSEFGQNSVRIQENSSRIFRT